MIRESIKNALLEIYTEEIPSSYVVLALKQIKEIAIKSLANSCLKYKNIKTYATCKRLVLIIEDIINENNNEFEYVYGPSLKFAKNNCDEYTEAAIGFAKKNGVAIEDFIVKDTANGKFISFLRKNEIKKTEELLCNIFSELIKKISFPKTMAWEESRFRFARPIRSIIALYGSKVIRFKIADVISSNWTTGLYIHNDNKIKIDLPENYISIMKNSFVIIDQNIRRETIKQSIKRVTKNIGRVVIDDFLIDEINYLVEYPSAIICSFNKSYLNLPFEVLNTCIKKIQKCFLVFDKKNNLSNYFVCIKNGISKYKKDIKNGYEKVVTARLSDAEFFYNKDLKNGLEYNIEKLKNIVLYNDAGTIYDKIIRIKRVAFFLNKEFNMMIDNNILERAIMLSKTDLVTEMVFEYPHLQGVIGKIYALKLGESNDVADSIEQHYWPLTASSKLPINNVAFLVSISDKIDTLVISFLIGISYSGSEDQHGLRRYGIGFMRMIIERLPNCNLEYIVKKIFDFLLNDTVNCVTLKKSYDNLIKFLYKRMESVFVSYGYQICDIKAVINTSMNKSNNSIRILKLKLEALRNARMNPGLSSIVIMFKRMTNIIHQAKEQGVNISKIIDENLLILNIEKTIYLVIQKTKIKIANCTLRDKYDEIFNEILGMKELIDVFFKEVVIMTDNYALKSNRVSIVNCVKNIFIEFVDFSYIIFD